MIVTSENIFPGARILIDEKPMTVVKVNAKSFYATSMGFGEFNDKYDKRLKGTTFLQFCKLNGIQPYKYSDSCTIEETEFNRRDLAIENSESKEKFKIDKIDKTAFFDLVRDCEKKGRSLRLAYTYSGKSMIRIIETMEHNFLLNIEDNYILYSMDTDECIKLGTVYDYNYKEIPWEKLSTYKEKEISIA